MHVDPMSARVDASRKWKQRGVGCACEYFLIIVSYLSRLSPVSCVHWAANSQTPQWTPNLICSIQKAFASTRQASPHRPTHFSIPFKLFFRTLWQILRIMKWWVFKNPWHTTPVWQCAMSHHLRFVRFIVPRAQLEGVSRALVCLRAGGEP